MIREILVIPDKFLDFTTSVARTELLFTPLHVHTELELLYIKRGTLDVSTDSGSYILNPGDFIIFNQNSPHSTYASFDAIYNTMQFNLRGIFDDEDVKELLSPSDNIPYLLPYIIFKRNTKDYDKLFSLHLRIEEHYKLMHEYPEFIKADFYSLYDFLALNGFFLPKPVEIASATFSRIIKAVNYINENYEEQISLEFLSSKFNFAPEYLCRSFKKVTGYTIVEYINYVRVKNAEKMMIYQKHSLGEIGRAVGFASQSYFIKTFKKFLRYTPLEYKKLKLGKSSLQGREFSFLFNEKGDIR